MDYVMSFIRKYHVATMRGVFARDLVSRVSWWTPDQTDSRVDFVFSTGDWEGLVGATPSEKRIGMPMWVLG